MVWLGQSHPQPSMTASADPHPTAPRPPLGVDPSRPGRSSLLPARHAPPADHLRAMAAPAPRPQTPGAIAAPRAAARRLDASAGVLARLVSARAAQAILAEGREGARFPHRFGRVAAPARKLPLVVALQPAARRAVAGG